MIIFCFGCNGIYLSIFKPKTVYGDLYITFSKEYCFQDVSLVSLFLHSSHPQCVACIDVSLHQDYFLFLNIHP